MRKLRLDLDALEVESFHADDYGRGDGTAIGQSVDNEPVGKTEFGLSCAHGSCWITCVGSCYTYAPILGSCVLGACSSECNPGITVD